jgi:membrane protein
MKLGPRTFWRLARESVAGWKADNCLSMGAALAFYSMLSLAPLLILVISIVGLVIGRDQAQELLIAQMSGLVGETGAQGIRTVLAAADTEAEGVLQGAISFAVLLVGATTVFGELQDDLNRIWRSQAPRARGLWGQLRKRLLSFGVIVALGFLMLVSLVVSAAVSYAGAAWFSGAEVVVQALVLGASLAVMTAIFALTFKVLPSRSIPWGDVLLGAFITAVLFSIGKSLIGLYIGKSAVASDFGAAGTLVVVIVWVYYSSQILFLGAQFTRAYSAGHGSTSGDRAANAEYGSDAAMVERARRIVSGSDPVLVEKAE